MIMSTNLKREDVIEKLEKMLEFFRHGTIKNEDFLININEQLDNVMPSLKYVPSEPSFDCLPTEIKTDILNYLCDSGAFVAASVSHEWKQILRKNLKQLDQVSLGKHCSNKHKCEETKCFMPEEFLRAALTHNLDVPLSICHPIRDIDTELLVEGLTTFSNLSIQDNCSCNGQVPSILPGQFKDFFKELEKKGKILNSLKLTYMDMTDFNQNQMNYLVNKVKNLELDVYPLFIETLLQISTDSKLLRLSLRQSVDSRLKILHCPNYSNMCIDFADAVCKVQSVELLVLPLGEEEETAERIVQNIQTRNISMKSFALDDGIVWRVILSPEELKKTLEKMDKLKLVGTFTEAQVEAAKSVSGVEASFHRISKFST